MNTGVIGGGIGGAAGSANRGGGGGIGGIGFHAIASGAALTNNGSITGGNGTSGTSGFPSGGAGGSGGAGASFAGTGATLTNTGTITGGNGGSGGAGGFGTNGPGGSGGVGVVGSGLTVINSGTISGGLASDGTTRANAIDFTGGTNRLELQVGSVITGNAVVQAGSGTLALGGATNSTFDVSAVGPAAQYRGFGAFEKTGTSTWTLTGTTTAVTPWTLNQGTLSVSSDANLGDPAGGLTFNGGILQITGTTFTSTPRAITWGANGGGFDIADAANTFTVGQTLAGPGGLTKLGPGTLVLTGANTYTGGTTIGAGTLIGSSSSFGTGGILNNAALVFEQPRDSTFAAPISGTGSLTKQGAGTLVLTGTSPLSGRTSVEAGGLIVNGSLANSVVTVNAGRLGGTGTLGGIVANGGTVAPGNSIGTLNVAGNVVFNPGATYQVEVNGAGQGDRTSATGTATINGGTVQVLAASGVYQPSTTYTILSAAAGVSGRFGPVFTNLAFLSPSLVYGPTTIDLVLARNDIPFGPDPTRPEIPGVAVTANQIAAARAAEALGPGNAVFNALLGLTADQARNAFDLLSGEVHGSVQSVLMEDSRYPRQAILGRLRHDAYAGAVGLMDVLGLDGPATYMADPPRTARAPLARPAAAPAFTMWAQALGAWGKLDGEGNAAKVDRNLGGLFGGIDTIVGEVWRIGIAAGYTRSDMDIDARLSSAEIETGHVGVYASTRFGALSARFGGAVSFHDIDTQRSIVFPGFSDRAGAGYDARTSQVFGEIGYGFALGQIALEPFAGLAFVEVETDRFREGGGAAALAGAKNSFDTGYSTIGLRMGTTYALANGMALLPRASLGWQHAFAEVGPTSYLAFASGSLPFSVRGAPIAQDSLLVEAGLDLAVSARARVGLSYAGALAERVQDQAVKANLSWNF
jgi:outer membrane autotransporter protein